MTAFFCDFFFKPEKILLWSRSLLNVSELKQVLKIVTLIWVPVSFLLSTFISHSVKDVVVGFCCCCLLLFCFRLLLLLFSLFCCICCTCVIRSLMFIFWWMSSRSLLLRSQTVLFEGVLSEISFCDPAVLFELGVKWFQEIIRCLWIPDFSVFLWTLYHSYPSL